MRFGPKLRGIKMTAKQIQDKQSVTHQAFTGYLGIIQMCMG